MIPHESAKHSRVFARIFKEALEFRQVAAGGFGAVLMNGVKRGLFSNEAGSGSAPCAAAAADCERPSTDGTGTGIRSLYRHDRDLQLYGNVDVISTTESDQWINRYELVTDSNELPFRRIRSCIYRSDPLDVQLLDISWNLILCKIQRRLPVR